MQRLGGPIIVLVALMVLVAIGGGLYFLFGPGANAVALTPLTANSNLAEHGGLTLSVQPDLVPNDFRVGLASLSADKFSSGSDEAFQMALAELPGYLTPFSPVYLVATQGTSPVQVTLALEVGGDPDENKTLDLYAWDGARWSFVPSVRNGGRLIAVTGTIPQAIAAFRTTPSVPVVSSALEVGQALSETGSTINMVLLGGLTLQADGSLVGAIAGGATPGQGYAVLPLVRTAEGDGALNAVLADPRARLLQIGSLVDLANNGNYNGVMVDYRHLDSNRSPAFTQFVVDLAAALHQQGKILGVVVPAPTLDGSHGAYTAGGYDLRSLGAAADIVELPLGDSAAAVGDGSARRMLTWAVGEVSRYKLRLQLSTLSTDTTDAGPRRLPASAALEAFGSAMLQTELAQIAPGAPITIGLSGKVQSLDYDPRAFAPRFTYIDEAGVTHTVTYVTPETLAHQLALADAYHLGGVSVRDLFHPGNPPGMIDALVRFKVNSAALTSSGAALSYTVTGADGVVVQATAAPGQPFTWTAGDPGQYSIAARLQSAGGAELGMVDVVVPQATVAPTATPAPTLRPAGTPLPTPTPCAGCPTATPAPTAAPTAGPVVVPGGGAWGPLELGGQVVHGGIPHAANMKRAKMTWVKLQGHSGDSLAAAINNAHAMGFKILLSIVGDRGSVMNPAYQQQYAQYMASLASQGADALEVWNEPNIDREWPTGQVSGQNYAQLLKTVYPAIKAANSKTIVISAAPAPTGFFGGCGAQGCDDKPFLEALVAAGGASYTDCIGIHYNEAIVSPREIGTDPRDNHYTRYYQTMVNTYAAAFQNARPLCFTELGILTPEGYPDLASTAPTFAWAANNTIAEQAQWLGEAATLARGTSAVRMMIVFNVDFTSYGADPQAGYAIIRADGTCPACDALAAAMP